MKLSSQSHVLHFEANLHLWFGSPLSAIYWEHIIKSPSMSWFKKIYSPKYTYIYWLFSDRCDNGHQHGCGPDEQRKRRAGGIHHQCSIFSRWWSLNFHPVFSIWIEITVTELQGRGKDTNHCFVICEGWGLKSKDKLRDIGVGKRSSVVQYGSWPISQHLGGGWFCPFWLSLCYRHHTRSFLCAFLHRHQIWCGGIYTSMVRKYLP